LRLLLDTHIWIWSQLEPERLRPRVADALEDSNNELWLSPLSISELIALARKGRVTLDIETADWIERAVATLSLREAPVTYEVAMTSNEVRLSHGDPIDMLLAATAKAFDLTLVTADQRLIGCKDIAVLANR
jgi:PIN domain nuclease of toxin-antitoxin system